MAFDDFVVLRIDEASASVLGSAATLATAKAASAVDEVMVETLTLSSSEAAEVAREPGVLSTARSMPVSLVKPFDAADEGAEASSGDATWGLEAVGALETHRHGAGVTVAILDSGINPDHEAFQGKEIIQKDFTGEGDGDKNGHGTHCAGTVFGDSVGGKRIGVANGVEKAFIGKVLNVNGGGTSDKIVEAMMWAAQGGANVISMSLGFDYPGMVAHLASFGYAIEEATSIALEAYRENIKLFETVAALVRAHSAMFSKCIVVAASGNGSKRPDFKITAEPPSAADGIISVGAAGRTNGPNANLTIAGFSNSKPAVAAPGVAIQSATHNSNDGLRILSGTSMAAPHVAGVAALWMEELLDDNPRFHIGELEANLKARATKSVFREDVDANDRGAGLVQAPLL